jgi:hypothetical protein
VELFFTKIKNWMLNKNIFLLYLGIFKKTKALVYFAKMLIFESINWVRLISRAFVTCIEYGSQPAIFYQGRYINKMS